MVKVTLIMMEHNFTSYFSEVTIVLQHLVFHLQSQNGNLNDVVSLFIIYELDRLSRDLNIDFPLKDCLFGAVKLTKDADPDKYKYSGYGIGFDLRSEFSFTDGSMGKNGIIFGADMSSSVHIDNTTKSILILTKGPIKGLDDAT